MTHGKSIENMKKGRSKQAWKIMAQSPESWAMWMWSTLWNLRTRQCEELGTSPPASSGGDIKLK